MNSMTSESIKYLMKKKGKSRSDLSFYLKMTYHKLCMKIRDDDFDDVELGRVADFLEADKQKILNGEYLNNNQMNSKSDELDGFDIVEVVEDLLKRTRRKRSELTKLLGITAQGTYYKLKNDAFSPDEIEKMAEFFGVDKSALMPPLPGSEAEKPQQGNEYLMKMIERMEAVFAETSKQKDSLIERLDKTVNLQQSMIELMDKQLKAALGKTRHNEELPVSKLKIAYIRPKIPAVQMGVC